MLLDARIPEGPLAEKWSLYKSKIRLINPANKRRVDVIVVGSGLAGASAAASLGELGYSVKCFCFQDSPRRAHSVAAQGGINAAKNYQNDGDNVYRLFFDTIKGGDYRSREANVYRLSELSVSIIDQCVAQGVPFAREYGGLLANRSFGGVQVQRTFYARGQTGQQLLLGSYSALSRQVAKGRVTMLPRREMLDLVLIDGKARGIVARNLATGELERHSAHAVVLATGGYGTAYYLSTLALGCNASAAWKAYKRGACIASPSFTQIHPTCIPAAGEHQSKLTLMSESLRNDGRIWVPKALGDNRPPGDIPEGERDYYLERKYPSYGNLAPRDVSSRAAKEVCDAGHGVGPTGLGVYLDFKDALARDGRDTIASRYGNLFEMYLTITGEDPYEVPMRIYPAAHFTMGGLWVDYDLMTTIPGLYAIGECNFADHGANRLGANSLLQACVDGYFVIPYTLGDYLADDIRTGPVATDTPAFDEAERGVRERLDRLLGVGGTTSPRRFHKQLGGILWDRCGMVRSAKGLESAITDLRALREDFWRNVRVTGRADTLNPELERAGRVADFLELAELICHDALDREESCGAHFREEYQTEDGEALRNDEEYKYVSVWEHQGDGEPPKLNKEHLEFANVELAVRSYK
ncbi:MAG: fumarate reductase/succinate dehydrogenase flavoprotein subunit [bacterium]|nr:fumarate reductase/succinate dehydrogenase flavoprotein subunit [bacterium]